jgi:long-chain acyl-CoA synthetase
LDGEIAKYRDGGLWAGRFPSRWLPSAVAVLGEGFTEQNHLMNSTMKMVRSRIVDFYRNRIDDLFTAEGKEIDNPQNRTIIARFE